MVIRNLRRCGAARMAAWTMSVAMVAWIPGTGVAFAAGTEMAGVGSALTVASHPVGAAVYVDGKAVGQTPLELPSLAAGDHRVKVVKDGYLENSRVVSVVSGQPGRLNVNLTPHAGRGEARMQVDPGPVADYDEGGGGGAKWLLIGAGVVAVGAGVYLLTRETNEAPTVSGVTVDATGEVAIASLTTVRFTAQATDPDGDTLSYTWDFGDGATGTGQSANHVYEGAGTYSVRVSVSDGEETATGSASVTVRNVSGRWVQSSSGITRTWRLTQSGNRAQGTYSHSLIGNGTVACRLQTPRQITCETAIPNIEPFVFEGEIDPGANAMIGAANGSGFNNTPMTFSRQ